MSDSGDAPALTPGESIATAPMPPYYSEADFLEAFLGGPSEITAENVLALDEQCLLRYLALLVALINQRLGGHNQTPQDEERLDLLGAIHKRVMASRPCKLRLSIILQLSEAWWFKGRVWQANCIHDPDCYEWGDADLSDALSGISEDALPSPKPDDMQSGSIDVDDLLKNDSCLDLYARSRFFHPERGIDVGKHLVGLRQVPASFKEHAAHLFLMRDLSTSSHSASAVGNRLLQRGWVNVAAHDSEKAFGFGRALYVRGKRFDQQDDVLVEEEADTTAGGENRLLKVTLAFDAVDLQSINFWRAAVWKHPPLIEGSDFGATSVVHPMAVDPKLIRDNRASAATDGTDSSGDSGSSDPPISTDFREGDSMGDAQADHGGFQAQRIKVTKVFSSIARPGILELTTFPRGACIYPFADAVGTTLQPSMIAKAGDNLINDMTVEMTFRLCNHVWSVDSSRFEGIRSGKPPFSFAYDVLPTSETTGLLEVVSGLEPLNKYDWAKWVEENKEKEEVLDCMVRSAAGSSVAQYILGCGDRHFDNIQIKDGRILMHIDFGYVLGEQPPIVTPPFCIGSDMEDAFKEVGIWGDFVDMCCAAFLSLRARSTQVSTLVSLLMEKETGMTAAKIDEFLASKKSFNVMADEAAAEKFVRDQVEKSAHSLETQFRQFAHNNIDKAFYGMLEQKFPPALLAIYIQEQEDQRKKEKKPFFSNENAKKAGIHLGEIPEVMGKGMSDVLTGKKFKKDDKEREDRKHAKKDKKEVEK